MKRVRTKTYTTTLYLVIFAVLIQLAIIFWNFRIRSQVIIDTQAPELAEKAPLPPTSNASSLNQKPAPLGGGSAPSTTLSVQERSQNLISEAKKFLEQGDVSLARNALLEAEKLQPQNTETLTLLAELAGRINNQSLAIDYWNKILRSPNLDSSLQQIAQEKIQQYSSEKLNLTPPVTASPSEPLATLPSEPPKEASSTPTNLTPVLPPPSAPENRARTLYIGTAEKKSLQSSSSKTEFILKIPIISAPGPQPVEPGKVSIKLYFYEQQSDGKIVPSTARLDVSFENRRPTWSRNTEILNALYSLPLSQRDKNYFGYRMRIYYKGEFQDEINEPEDLNEKYPMTY